MGRCGDDEYDALNPLRRTTFRLLRDGSFESGHVFKAYYSCDVADVYTESSMFARVIFCANDLPLGVPHAFVTSVAGRCLRASSSCSLDCSLDTPNNYQGWLMSFDETTVDPTTLSELLGLIGDELRCSVSMMDQGRFERLAEMCRHSTRCLVSSFLSRYSPEPNPEPNPDPNSTTSAACVPDGLLTEIADRMTPQWARWDRSQLAALMHAMRPPREDGWP